MKLKKMTRAQLLRFANTLYNPKTRKYKKLSQGIWKDDEGAKSCVLGELYRHLTGRYPANTVTCVRLLEKRVASAAEVNWDSVWITNDAETTQASRAKRTRIALRAIAEKLK